MRSPATAAAFGQILPFRLRSPGSNHQRYINAASTLLQRYSNAPGGSTVVWPESTITLSGSASENTKREGTPQHAAKLYNVPVSHRESRRHIMAPHNADDTQIRARLARGECANYRQGGCRGREPCAVETGDACAYFTSYVEPLIKIPDVSARYTREARIARVTGQVKKSPAKRTAPAPPLPPPVVADAPLPVPVAPDSPAVIRIPEAPAPVAITVPAPVVPALHTPHASRTRRPVAVGQMALDLGC
jgi:hypothetical protein